MRERLRLRARVRARVSRLTEDVGASDAGVALLGLEGAVRLGREVLLLALELGEGVDGGSREGVSEWIHLRRGDGRLIGARTRWRIDWRTEDPTSLHPTLQPLLHSHLEAVVAVEVLLDELADRCAGRALRCANVWPRPVGQIKIDIHFGSRYKTVHVHVGSSSAVQMLGRGRWVDQDRYSFWLKMQNRTY